MKIIAAGFGEPDVLPAVPHEPPPPRRGEVTMRPRVGGRAQADPAGINIVGTAGEKSFGELRGYGAQPVRYGDGLAGRVRAVTPDGIDAAIDLIGTGEAVDVSLALVADQARIATAVASGRAREAGIQTLGGSPGQDAAGIAIRDAARLRLTALAQAGAFEVKVVRCFPLAEAAQAHRLLSKGGGGGRIVLTAWSPSAFMTPSEVADDLIMTGRRGPGSSEDATELAQPVSASLQIGDQARWRSSNAFTASGHAACTK